MAEDEMYLSNLDAWVCEEKKTVTYRWLSNELSVPSNVAKQMLYAFAEKKGKEVQSIYLLSGNKEGHGHTVTLVSGSNLTEAKKKFDPIFSLHVYSVQAVLPKDSAHLWTVDNEQAKLLFVQPDNPIDSNRWSGLDYPEGMQRREVLQPPAASPHQPAQAVKKETKAKVKLQPKDESSSQPSSPEKATTTTATTAATKSGGRLTTVKAAGKKGAASSPTKRPGTREMTTFFKKAPEEEKTQTLIANAKAGKGKGTSPAKGKAVMESFFAKKEKTGDDDENEEDEGNEGEDEGDDGGEEDGRTTDQVRKIKEEEEKQDAGALELDELLSGEPTTKPPAKAKAKAKPAAEPKQKRKRGAAAADGGDFDDDMDFESKTDVTRRKRLQRGKRKRNDDGDDNEEEDEATTKVKTKTGTQVKKEKKEEERNEEEEEEEEGGKKKKRRRVVPKDAEEDEEEKEEEAEPQPKKKRATATTAAKGKKGRRKAAVKEAEEAEKEEKEEEKEEEEEETPKKKKEKPVERKGGVAKVAGFGLGQRRKKKVRKERTYVDDKGFEVTEDVWEEVSDEDVPVPVVALASIKDEPANNADAAAVKKKGTTQVNIMSFFGKK